MTTVRVNASSAYDIIIGKNLLEKSGELISGVISPCRACIVSDDNVTPLYLDTVRASMECSGFEVIDFVFANGESSKNTDTLISLLEFLAQNRLTRSDCLVALGGGVVGDLCGFAAAVYLRSVRFVQIPTTLLAAVDSSVGGKTGVDLRAGKNLAGAFHQPSLVICDYSTLDTLPRKIFADGCAEVIKYGIINNADFFERLRDGIDNSIEDVIATCVSSKRDIVQQDEFDTGARRLLNLGHTVGHAVEVCSDFGISHGSAVAIGTVIVMRAATSLGICKSGELERVIAAFERVGLPTKCEFTAEQLCAVATADKKREGDTITLVVPYSVGDTRLLTLPIGELCDFIARGLRV